MAGGETPVSHSVGGLNDQQMPPVSTASYGKVLPVVYGTNRLPVQIICMPPELWLAGTNGGAAGKGGGNGQAGYYQGVWCAIAEGGPLCTTGRMWIDKDVFPTATTEIDPVPPPYDASTPFEYLPGTRPQSVPSDWALLGTPASPCVVVVQAGATTTTVTVLASGHLTGYAQTLSDGYTVAGGTITFADGETRIINTVTPSGSNDVLTLTVPLTTAPTSGATAICVSPLTQDGLNYRTVTATVPSASPFTLAVSFNGSLDSSWIGDANITSNIWSQIRVGGSPIPIGGNAPYLYPGPIGALAGAAFKGSTSGTTLTISSTQIAGICAGMPLYNNGLIIAIVVSGSGTSWTLDRTTALGAGTQFYGGCDYSATNGVYTFSGATFTATFNGTTTMNVTAVSAGTLIPGMQVICVAAGVPTNCAIASLGTGTGGTGTYILTGAAGTLAGAAATCGQVGASLNPLTYWISMDLSKYSIGYGGTALLVTKALSLGNSNAMKNISVEFLGFGTGGSLDIAYGEMISGDTNPAGILADMMTNTAYGMGYPSASVNTTIGLDGTLSSGLWAWCAAAGVRLSPIFDQQKDATEWIDWILKACNAVMVESQGVLNVYPRADVAVGNASFTATLSNGSGGSGLILNVSAVASGTIYLGMPIVGAGIPAGSSIASFVSGTGTTGTYTITPTAAHITSGTAMTGGYTPYLTAQYAVNESNMLAGEDEDMLEFERKNPAAVINSCPVEFVDSQCPDANSQYMVSLNQDIEEPNVQTTGGRLLAEGTLSLKCITKAAIAQLISRARAQREVYIRDQSFKIRLPQAFTLLDPFDLLDVTDSLIGFSAYPLRILAIEEENGVLELELEDAGIGSHSALKRTLTFGQGGGHRVNTLPFTPSPPMLWMPPLQATGRLISESTSNTPAPVKLGKAAGNATTPEIWVATASPGTDWGGAQVWISYDATNFNYAGDVGTATTGVLASSFAAGAPVDTTNTLSVNLAQSLGTMSSVPVADRDAFQSMCLVDTGTAAELLAYETAALSGGNYNLTNHRRGLYGTLVSAHAAGVQFTVVDQNVLRVQLDSSRIVAGGTVYVKLASYNLARTQIMSLATAPVFTYAMAAAGPQGTQALPVIENLPARITFDNYDASQWDFPVSGPGQLSLITVTGLTGQVVGGLSLQCANGNVMMVQRQLIPYDITKIYKIETAVEINPGSGSIYVGFVAVGVDGVTQYDYTGTAGVQTDPTRQFAAVLTGHKSVLVQLFGYFSGSSNTPSTPPLSINPFAPSLPPLQIAYLRPFIAFVLGSGNTGAVDYLRVDEYLSADYTSQFAAAVGSLVGTTTNPNDTWGFPNDSAGNAPLYGSIKQVTVGGVMVPASGWTQSAGTPANIVFAGQYIPQDEAVQALLAYPYDA